MFSLYLTREERKGRLLRIGRIPYFYYSVSKLIWTDWLGTWGGLVGSLRKVWLGYLELRITRNGFSRIRKELGRGLGALWGAKIVLF